MAATRRQRRRRRGHLEPENEDRWLLTYADMITLLLALFMVLFSISSVNKAKFVGVQQSLQDAFSGNVLSGGKSFQQTGGSDQLRQSAPQPPVPALKPLMGDPPKSSNTQSPGEDQDFRQLKRQIDQYVREHGLDNKVQTTIARRGLVIRLLTDRILFDSGSARIKPEGRPLMTAMARLLKFEVRHPISVEGHTDNVPIRNSVFPTNWELSTGRAASVVRYLIREGVGPARLAAAGYGSLHPAVSNATAGGRSRNRRVEIALLRLSPTEGTEQP